MFCFLKMLVKKIETSHFLRAIFIFGCQILLFSCLYAKTLYYYEPSCLLNISITNERIYKLFFSPENWDPYANFEYRTISLPFWGAEIFAKQNRFLKLISSNFSGPKCPCHKNVTQKIARFYFFLQHFLTLKHMGHYLSTLTNRKWKKAPMRGPFYLYLSYDWQVPIPWQLLWNISLEPWASCYRDKFKLIH